MNNEEITKSLRNSDVNKFSFNHSIKNDINNETYVNSSKFLYYKTKKNLITQDKISDNKSFHKEMDNPKMILIRKIKENENQDKNDNNNSNKDKEKNIKKSKNRRKYTHLSKSNNDNIDMIDIKKTLKFQGKNDKIKLIEIEKQNESDEKNKKMECIQYRSIYKYKIREKKLEN